MNRQAEFAEFWSQYPKHVGKLAAQRAYDRARKTASADAILAGLMAYMSHLPAEKQFILHPASFLNQGRWADEYDAVKPKSEREDWFEECKRIHNGECALNRYWHQVRKDMENKH